MRIWLLRGSTAAGRSCQRVCACGCSRLGVKETPAILEKAELFSATHSFHFVQLLLDRMQPCLNLSLVNLARWTREELDGLFTLQMEGASRILPVWHKVTKADVIAHSPILAG